MVHNFRILKIFSVCALYIAIDEWLRRVRRCELCNFQLSQIFSVLIPSAVRNFISTLVFSDMVEKFFKCSFVYFFL